MGSPQGGMAQTWASGCQQCAHPAASLGAPRRWARATDIRSHRPVAPPAWPPRGGLTTAQFGKGWLDTRAPDTRNHDLQGARTKTGLRNASNKGRVACADAVVALGRVAVRSRPGVSQCAISDSGKWILSWPISAVASPGYETSAIPFTGPGFPRRAAPPPGQPFWPAPMRQ